MAKAWQAATLALVGVATTLSCVAALYFQGSWLREVHPESSPAAVEQTMPAVGRSPLTIRGAVTDSSGKPLYHVSVSLTPRLGAPGTVAATDTQGNYEIPHVTPGSYYISAAKLGFVTTYVGQRRPSEPVMPVALSGEESNLTINFRLTGGGIVEGTVVDEIDGPLPDVIVGLIRSDETYGDNGSLAPLAESTGWRDVESKAVRTDDRGHFRLAGVPPGSYFVVAPLSGPIEDATNSQQRVGYVRTYFPGVHSPADARPVWVRDGQRVAVRFPVILGRLASVNGTVKDSAGGQVRFGFARLARLRSASRVILDSSTRLAQIANDGSFVIGGVAPGDYAVAVTIGAPWEGGIQRDVEIGRRNIRIVGHNEQRVSISTAPGGIVSGQVVFEGRHSPMSLTTLRVVPHAVAGEYLGITPLGSAAISRDGSFTLRNVFGRTVLSVDAGDGWYQKGVYFNGSDVTDSGIDPGAGGRLEGVRIVLTNRPTKICGTLFDQAGRSQADGWVIVYAVDERRWTNELGRYIKVTRTDGLGRYAISGLPAGEYFAIGAASLEATVSVTDLRAAQRSAERLHIMDAGTQTYDVHLTRGEIGSRRSDVAFHETPP